MFSRFLAGTKVHQRTKEMAMITKRWLQTRAMLKLAGVIRRPGTRDYGEFHDSLEHATGLEKRELLAHLAGNCDPFRMLCLKRGQGTRERPNLVPSAFDKRLVGCLCTPDTMHIEWMWLHSSDPKRCACGYWFELCSIAPIVA